MRVPLVLAVLVLLAGCLEPANEPMPPGATTPLVTSSTPPPASTSTTPTTTTTPSPTPEPTTPNPTPAPVPVAVRTLASGAQARGSHDERMAFYDRAEYEAFWQSVREGDEPAPEVDFASSTVVAAVSDARPDSCWALRITSATDEGTGTTRVEVTTYTPPRGMMCADVITYPWHLVALEGADRTVAFAELEAEGPPAS